MADAKPHEATQSRLDRARREGDAARSQDLIGLSAFAAALATVAAIAAPMGSALGTLLNAAFSRVAMPMETAYVQVAALALLPAFAAASGAMLCAWLQTGGVRLISIAPRFDRLSPAANAKRIVSRESAVQALKTAAAFACAAVVTFMAARNVAGVGMRGSSEAALSAASWHATLVASWAACAVAALFGGGDYALQLQRWRRNLRMSHDELQRDRKEQEGDPTARSRRRFFHRQFSRGSLQRVQDAAFVVCNPLHIAVALEYRPPEVPVPRVVVRAADEFALRVREAAAERSIPIVENVALARTLYASCGAQQFIPPETYVAVAEIVASLARVPS